MASRRRSDRPVMELSVLQGRAKADRDAYVNEVEQQHAHFLSSLQLVQFQLSTEAPEFVKLVSFISHMCPVYAKMLKDVPHQMFSLLDEHGTQLHRETRMAVVLALILLKNRGLIDSLALHQLFFRFFGVLDKALRRTIYEFIVADISRTSEQKHMSKVARSLQSHVLDRTVSSASDLLDEMDSQMVEKSVGLTPLKSAQVLLSSGKGRKRQKLRIDRTQEVPVVVVKALSIILALHKKGLWNDEKTVNCIAVAALSAYNKVAEMALRFFLQEDEAVRDDDNHSLMQDAAEAQASAIDVAQSLKVAGKTGSRKRKLEQTVKREKRLLKKESERQEEIESTGSRGAFASLNLVHDPQSFSERLFAALRRSSAPFETRLLMMRVVSCMISVHSLLLLNFYPFMLRYLNPHQMRVPTILACVAQSAHKFVPDDALSPVVRQIADAFVSDHCRADVMALGINSIREICVRVPSAIEDTLLHEIVALKKHHDKGVSIAARSILIFYRSFFPERLEKKDRGRFGTMATAAGEAEGSKKGEMFGAVHVADGVEGIELLTSARARGELPKLGILPSSPKRQKKDDGWIDVSSDDEADIVLSGSDDDLDWDAAEVVEVEEQGDDESTAEVEVEKPVPLDKVTILDEEDFEHLKKLKKKQLKENLLARVRPGKRGRDAEMLRSIVDQHEKGAVDGMVDEGKLISVEKKARATYEERMASVKEGRANRESYGHDGKGRKKGGGLTNIEKTKSKPFMMVKQKREIREKNRMSLAQRKSKQLKSRKKVLKQKLRHH